MDATSCDQLRSDAFLEMNCGFRHASKQVGQMDRDGKDEPKAHRDARDHGFQSRYRQYE
jgi:hypothetical protein